MADINDNHINDYDVYEEVTDKTSFSHSSIAASHMIDYLLENVMIELYLKEINSKSRPHSVNLLLRHYSDALYPNQRQPLDIKVDDYKAKQDFPLVK